MALSRRGFLKLCGISAAALGFDGKVLRLVEQALADPNGPVVIWLKGASCDGCSISLLNRTADEAPTDVASLLLDNVNLVYHTNLSTLCGDTAVAALRQAYDAGNYVLVFEGGVSTAFHGNACVIYSYRGRSMTYAQAVVEYAARALAVISIGTCASYGGIPAAPPNPGGVVGVSALLPGRSVIHLPGCPCNPDWFVWTVVQLLVGNPVPLDANGRPTALYEVPGIIHDNCPRNVPGNEATGYGQAGKCLINLGCRGPSTQANCPERIWNGKPGAGAWCIGVNAPCHGCVEPTFPGTASFYEPYNP
jgi:NiFe hydrogenase small subunit HydA